MTNRVLFLSGTDTEVGKTHVGVALARELTKRGHRIITVKPVESGVEGEHIEDGVRLSKATGQQWPTEALQRFKAPVAPPIAAEMEHKSIDPIFWEKQVNALLDKADLVMVEGAGGLLSPLDWDLSLLDFSRKWRSAFVIVDTDSLGAVGRNRLCLSVLETAETPVLGVVLSAPEHTDQTTGKNANTLSKVVQDTLIATLPRTDNHAELAEALKGIIRNIEIHCLPAERTQ